MKKNNIKVSIIVPVYNGEKTIERCIDSLLKQDYIDIEIILINDGSTDNSLKLIKKYQKLNSNIIKVYSHNNCGVGKTRNKGIDNATGDYITFVDADDALEKDAISNLVENLDKDTDIIISGLKRKNEFTNQIIFDIKPINCLWSEFKYTSTQFKLFRKAFLNDNKIRYSSYKIGEDIYFCLSCYSKTEKIKIVPKSKYINYYNDDSVTTTMNYNGKKYDILYILEEIDKNLNLNKYPKEMVNYFYIKTIVQNIIMQLDGINLNELNELYLKNYKWLKNKYKVKLHWQKGEIFSINLLVNIFIFFTKIRLQKMLIFCLKKCKYVRMK